MIKLKMMKILVLLNSVFIIIISMTQSAKISPCTVQNVMLLPKFGFSAKTKPYKTSIPELVNILQVPPVFTQKIHADICVNSDTSSDRISNHPRFLCRQRYSVAEVYLKEDQENLHGIPNIQAMLRHMSEGQVKTDFVKDYIVTEAGCDFFINIFPNRGAGLHDSLKKASLPGIASLHGESYANSPGHNLQQMLQHLDERKPAKFDLDYNNDNREIANSNLKPRSMTRNDFFTNGLHVHSEAKLNMTDSSDKSNSFTTDEATNNNDEISDDDLAEGEIRLTPENIGLPLLILESSLDPIMKLIS